MQGKSDGILLFERFPVIEIGPFDGAKACAWRLGREAPLRVNFQSMH
jgi:hypothetical protein